MELSYRTNDLIAAPATPRGRGALAVIRSSGPQCIETFSRIFSHPDRLKKSDGNQVHYGWLMDAMGNRIDEVLVTLFRSPSSYTGQDSIEVSCHGGPVVTDKVMELFRSIGFRDSAPGEFTFRAFFSGKIDLTKAEAVNEIISARTDKARALAVSRLAGSIGAVINTAKNHIKRQAAIAALALDYAEDEVEAISFDYTVINKVRLSLESMMRTWKTGRLYKDGIRVALAGPVNAGKSSLFNLFLKEERSIVTDTPGTTRDWVEAWVNFDGIPLCLVDTAGLRGEISDPVEKEGIRRTRELITASDFIVVVADGCAGIAATETFCREEFHGSEGQSQTISDRLIRVWNKADLAPTAPEGWIAVSTLNGTGFVDLENTIRAKVLENGAGEDGDAPVIDSIRQKKLLEYAAAALLRFENSKEISIDLKAEDLRDALNALGELTGEVSQADVLNLMFSEFCVGK